MMAAVSLQGCHPTKVEMTLINFVVVTMMVQRSVFQPFDASTTRLVTPGHGSARRAARGRAMAVPIAEIDPGLHLAFTGMTKRQSIFFAVVRPSGRRIAPS